MKALFHFSKITFAQNRSALRLPFWSWLGGAILLYASTAALCLAAEIAIQFLHGDSLRNWILCGLWSVAGITGFCFLTPLWYHFLEACLTSANLHPVQPYSVYGYSLFLRILRILPLVPIPFFYNGIFWCLEHGMNAEQAIWWLLGAVQCVTGGILCVIFWLWEQPILAAVPLVGFIVPQKNMFRTLHSAARLVSGNRRTYLHICMLLLPQLLTLQWDKAAFTLTICMAAQMQERQYYEKGVDSHGTNASLAGHTEPPYDIGAVPQN